MHWAFFFFLPCAWLYIYQYWIQLPFYLQVILYYDILLQLLAVGFKCTSLNNNTVSKLCYFILSYFPGHLGQDQSVCIPVGLHWWSSSGEQMDFYPLCPIFKPFISPWEYLLFMPLQLGFFSISLASAHWKHSLRTLWGAWSLSVYASNWAERYGDRTQQRSLQKKKALVVHLVCMRCSPGHDFAKKLNPFSYNSKNAFSPSEHDGMPETSCCCASMPQGCPFSRWRCTQTPTAVKSVTVCKELGLLHI